ncbi:hypothetical protein B0H13DRAFT_1899443 [Mycena leptocephala]|nr:hypothetical protein B0H13DRAFT_1899443 [Mycena leptocephala]
MGLALLFSPALCLQLLNLMACPEMTGQMNSRVRRARLHIPGPFDPCQFVLSHPPSTGNQVPCGGLSEHKSVKNVDPDAQEILVNLLLSPKDNLNIFTTAPKSLIKMLISRHISKPAYLTIAGARHALLGHLSAGDVIRSYRPASQDRLPDEAIKIVADCRGWEDHARSAVLSRPWFTIILDLLPKGTLMSIAQVHGIFLKDATNDSLRQAITQHAIMGIFPVFFDFLIIPKVPVHSQYRVNSSRPKVGQGLLLQFPTHQTIRDLPEAGIYMVQCPGELEPTKGRARIAGPAASDAGYTDYFAKNEAEL